jgi:hypothetical protein
VIVANNPTVNALATPGGSIVVFRGLLERTENAEELAGVLAHEIQHVMHRHSTKAILRQASAGVLMAALVGDVSAVVAFGLQSARTLGDLRYSRQAELEADRDGARMLHAAAVDPAGMVSFFQAMQREEGAPRTAVPLDPPAAATACRWHRPPGRGPPGLLPDWTGRVKKMCGGEPDCAGAPAWGGGSRAELGVVDGVGDRGRRRDRATLAQALHPQRVARRGVLEVHGLDRRQLRGGGDQVVHEAPGQQLPLIVVDHLLEERATDALGHAAVHLALHDHRVDDLAAVVRDDVAQQPVPTSTSTCATWTALA